LKNASGQSCCDRGGLNIQKDTYTAGYFLDLMRAE
jgi:hypothetical protein